MSMCISMFGLIGGAILEYAHQDHLQAGFQFQFMPMTSQSVLEWLGLPVNFGYALLIVGLVLSLSPYLGSSDFGVLKIPDFKPPVRSTLKKLGPTVMFGAILIHVQILPMSVSNGEGSVAPEPRNQIVQDAGEGGSVSGSLSLAPGSNVLAPFGDAQCLYRATVLESESDPVSLRFSFGKDGTAPEARLKTPPASPLAEPVPGAAIYVRLDGSDIWAPGVIKEISGGRAFSDLEPATDCAGQYSKPHIWSDLNEPTLIAREN